jgi:hypothetical protein
MSSSLSIASRTYWKLRRSGLYDPTGDDQQAMRRGGHNQSPEILYVGCGEARECSSGAGAEERYASTQDSLSSAVQTRSNSQPASKCFRVLARGQHTSLWMRRRSSTSRSRFPVRDGKPHILGKARVVDVAEDHQIQA